MSLLEYFLQEFGQLNSEEFLTAQVLGCFHIFNFNIVALPLMWKTATKCDQNTVPIPCFPLW